MLTLSWLGAGIEMKKVAALNLFDGPHYSSFWNETVMHMFIIYQ
jgi:hypothetical protein